MKSFVIFLTLISAVRSSLVLNCDFKYLVDLDDDSRKLYACESMEFTNTFQGEALHYVTNLHEHGQRDRDVKIFSIKKQICHFIPQKIESFFPFLQELEVDSSGLRKVQRENFANLPQLRSVSLPRNEIEHIPGDLFARNPRVAYIDFSRNRIKSIGHELFENLYSLVYLKFDDNVCFEGFEKFESDVAVIRDEVLANCSAVVRQEKKIKSQKNEENVQENGKAQQKVMVTTTTFRPMMMTTTLRTTTTLPVEMNEIPQGRLNEPKQLARNSTHYTLILSKLLLIMTIILISFLQQIQCSM